jgi:hypothetical protein
MHGSSEGKIVSSRWCRSQNSSHFGDGDLDGLTPAHLAHDEKQEVSADSLLVHLDTSENVVA